MKILINVIMMLVGVIAFGQTPSKNQADKEKEPAIHAVRTGKIGYQRIRNDSSQLVGDLTYIRFDGLEDFTKKLDFYHHWRKQSTIIFDEIVIREIYQQKHIAENMRLYVAEEYPDSLPDPSVIISFQLIDFALMKGIKRQEPIYFYSLDQDGALHYGDVDYQRQLKTVFMQGIIRVQDAKTCREFFSMTLKIEYSADKNNYRLIGDERVIPTIYHNYRYSPHREILDDETLVYRGMKKLYQELMHKLYYHYLQRIDDKRQSIKNINTSF